MIVKIKDSLGEVSIKTKTYISSQSIFFSDTSPSESLILI